MAKKTKKVRLFTTAQPGWREFALVSLDEENGATYVERPIALWVYDGDIAEPVICDGLYYRPTLSHADISFVWPPGDEPPVAAKYAFAMHSLAEHIVVGMKPSNIAVTLPDIVAVTLPNIVCESLVTVTLLHLVEAELLVVTPGDAANFIPDTYNRTPLAVERLETFEVADASYVLKYARLQAKKAAK
jgi:hypothetical protein